MRTYQRRQYIKHIEMLSSEQECNRKGIDRAKSVNERLSEPRPQVQASLLALTFLTPILFPLIPHLPLFLSFRSD